MRASEDIIKRDHANKCRKNNFDKHQVEGFRLHNVCANFGPWIEYEIIFSPLTTSQLFGVFRSKLYNVRVKCLKTP